MDADSAIEGIFAECRPDDRAGRQRMVFIMDVVKIDRRGDPRGDLEPGLDTSAKRGPALGRQKVGLFQSVARVPTERGPFAGDVIHCAFDIRRGSIFVRFVFAEFRAGAQRNVQAGVERVVDARERVVRSGVELQPDRDDSEDRKKHQRYTDDLPIVLVIHEAIAILGHQRRGWHKLQPKLAAKSVADTVGKRPHGAVIELKRLKSVERFGRETPGPCIGHESLVRRIEIIPIPRVQSTGVLKRRFG